MDNTCNILLAEDDESNQLLLEKILSKQGYSITVVNNGQEAIDELEKTHYGICILDMQMPILSGIDALKTYKNINPQGHVSFIMLSADESKDTVNQCLDAGADMYLVKPATQQKLTEAINLVLGEKGTSVVEDDINDNTKDCHLDISRLKSIHDQTFMDEFIGLFETSADKLLNTLSLSLENDIDIFKQTAHSIKGLSGNIGATRLRELTSLAEIINAEEYAASSKSHYENISKELLKVRIELVKHSSENQPKSN